MNGWAQVAADNYSSTTVALDSEEGAHPRLSRDVELPLGQEETLLRIEEKECVTLPDTAPGDRRTADWRVRDHQRPLQRSWLGRSSLN